MNSVSSSGSGNRFSRMWTTAVLNAITNRASSASKNLSVRYSSIPNNDGGGASTASASNLSKIMGGSGIILPLDVDETVTCFCRWVWWICCWFGAAGIAHNVDSDAGRARNRNLVVQNVFPKRLDDSIIFESTRLYSQQNIMVTLITALFEMIRCLKKAHDHIYFQKPCNSFENPSTIPFKNCSWNFLSCSDIIILSQSKQNGI